MEGFTLPSLCKISLAFFRVALVILFPTKLDSPQSELSCKSYSVYGLQLSEDPVVPASSSRLLIRAFYIIIFIPYIIILECYMHCYINVLHVLDELWDFHTKSLFLVFYIWEAEYPPFLVFIVSGVS